MLTEARLDANVQRYVDELVERVSRLRLRELLVNGHPDALWHVANRHGVSVVALKTPALTEEQLRIVMTYRLAQYVMAHQLDPRMLYAAGLDHEPLSNVSQGDIHVIAGAAESGEILCYGTFKAITRESDERTLSARDRPLFPVEEVFGWGVYNRLRILPDLPIARIREAGRLVKNHRHHCLDELLARAPVEALIVGFQLVSGPLLGEVQACVGDIELSVAKKNQDFLHLPTVIVRGVVPYAAEGSYGFWNYQHRTRYPYALLCSDISKARLEAIEKALALPSHECLAALFALKADGEIPRSSLEPRGGLPPLALADVPQQGVAMETRREWLDVGERLRNTEAFRGLSVSEAAVLGTLVEPCSVLSGEVLIRQGGSGDALYVIDSGQAEVRVVTAKGERIGLAVLGRDDVFGEIAVVTGAERTADVVAITPMTLLKISREAYTRYLAHAAEVDKVMTRTALDRTRDTLRTVTQK